jgi:hypothetical protein
MFVFAAIISVLLAFIKYNDYHRITRYALKLFIYMVGGVIVFSWFMYFV